MNWKAIIHDLAAPLVDLTIDGVMSAAKPRRSRSDEDLEELKKLAQTTPKTPKLQTEETAVPAPIMPHSHTLKLKQKKIPPGKKRLLNAMDDLFEAERHVFNKFPELAREIRIPRKKIEDAIL